MESDFDTALADLARAATASVAAASAAGGAAARQALPALAAELTPALAHIRGQLAGLDTEARIARFKAALDKIRPAEAARPVRGLAAILCNPASQSSIDGLIALYLLLWLLDQAIIAGYEATRKGFSIDNPARDFWYQRTDTAGSHKFFTDGNYLTNTIPQTDGNNYYNAEIYNSTQTQQQPKNVIVNLFPVDSPKDIAHFLYDIFLNVPFAPANGLLFEARIKVENLTGGSRGWGFWNTDVFPPSMQIAWFIQYQGAAQKGVEPIYPDGFYAITQNGIDGLTPPSAVKLADLDENWHDYRIEFTANSVAYYVDGICVATATDPDNIPTAPMAFHNWVDNAQFGFADGVIRHILQKTDAPRSNIMQNLHLEGLGAGS